VLAQPAACGRIARALLADRAQTAVSHEHLSDFVAVTITDHDGRLDLAWTVDAARRRELDRTRFGRHNGRRRRPSNSIAGCPVFLHL
jgi:hypothetical protein